MRTQDVVGFFLCRCIVKVYRTTK